MLRLFGFPSSWYSWLLNPQSSFLTLHPSSESSWLLNLHSSPHPPLQWVCMAEEPGRRYDWVEYENGVQLGNKGTCRSE